MAGTLLAGAVRWGNSSGITCAQYPGCQGMDVQCGVSSWWEHHLCVFRLVSCTSGPVRICRATQSMTGTGIYRTHITPEHTLGGPSHSCAPSLPAFGYQEEFAWAQVTDTSTYTFLSLQKFSQRRLLSRKALPRQFLKKPQPCDGFKHNSKATNTTTVGSSCQSTRCCCWKKCSAATGSGLPCHQRQRRGRRREQEPWAPALLVQKEKKVGQKETSLISAP